LRTKVVGEGVSAASSTSFCDLCRHGDKHMAFRRTADIGAKQPFVVWDELASDATHCNTMDLSY
jgi:hypothetical protein